MNIIVQSRWECRLCSLLESCLVELGKIPTRTPSNPTPGCSPEKLYSGL